MHKEDQELVEEENEKVLKDELTSHEEAVIEGHMQVQSGGLDTNYLLQLENQKRKSCREIVVDEVHKLADQLENDDSSTNNAFKTTTKERKQLAIKAVSDKVVQSLQSSVSELPVLAYTQNKALLSPVMKAIQYRGEKLGLRVVSHAERDMSHMEELHEISLAAAKAEERRNARDSRISTRGSSQIGSSSRPQTAATDHEVDESAVMKEEKQLLEMDESYHMRALHDSVRERFWDRSERQFVTEMLRGKVTWQELREWFGGSGKNYGSALQSQQMFLRNGLFLTDLIINYKLQNLDGSEARTNLEKDKQQRILLRTRLADQKDFGTKSFESAVRITEQAVEYFQRTIRKNKHLKNSAQREFSFLENKKKLVNFAKKQLLQEWLTRFDRILLPKLEENALTSFETFHNMRMGLRTTAGGVVDAASSNGNQNMIMGNRKMKGGSSKQKQARDTSSQNASSSADPEALKEKGLIELKSHLKTSSNKTNIVKQPLHLEPIDPRWVGETAWVLKPKDLEDKGTSNQHKTDGTSLTGILSNARRSAKRSSLLAGDQMGGKSQDPMLQNISDGTARDTYLQHLDGAVTDEEHYKSLKKIRLDQEQQHSAHMLVGVDLDRGLLNFDNSFASTNRSTSPTTGVGGEEEDGLEDGGNSDLDLFLEDPGMLHGVNYDHDGTAAASAGNLSRASTAVGLSNNYNRSSQLSSKGKSTTANTFNPRLLPTAGYQEIVSAKRVQLQEPEDFYTRGAADDRNHDTIADPAIFDSFATIAAESEDEEVLSKAPSTTSAKSTLAAHQPAPTRTPASPSATPASQNHKQYWADPRELVHLLPNSRFPGAGTNILKKVDIKTLKISKSKQAASNFTNSASFFNRDKLLNAPKTDRMLIFESAAEHDRDVVLSYQEMLAEWILGPLLKPSRHIFKSQSEIKHREFLEKTPDVFSKRATEKMKTGLSQKVKQKHAVDTGLVQFLEHHELHDLRAILEADIHSKFSVHVHMRSLHGKNWLRS